MTYIAKPLVKDSLILNDIGRDLLINTDEPNKTLLRRSFKLLTEDGVVHEVSFEQMDGLINILDLGRETPIITPLQYLVTAYGLSDLTSMGEAGWAVSEYIVTVMHNSESVRFEGRLTLPGNVDKVFTYALGGFGFIQQFSLSRVISSQHEKLAEVAGTFDMTYTFSFGPDGIKLNTHSDED